MTLNKYLSNATSSGISAKQSYDMLVSEFRKGNISYPRSDGKNHLPIKILNENAINKQVKNWLEKTPNFEIKEYDNDNMIISGDYFILNEYLKLSTPATVVNDYDKCCRLKYKEEENKYIGLEHNHYENELANEKIELTNFSFEDIILDAVAFELDIPQEQLEINFVDLDRF